MAGAPWNVLDATGRRIAWCNGEDYKKDSNAEDEANAALMAEAPKLLDEIERLARERGQACYERDNARSVVKHWEERALAAEAEVERLKVLIEGHIRDAD
jgi:hypothetical protein